MAPRLLLILFFVTTTASAIAAPAGAPPKADTDAAFSSDTCSEGGDRQQIECLSARIDHLKVDLDSAYHDALAKLPERGDQDLRGGREQLRRSEDAWLRYEQANCPLVGALQGGSSSWITHFSALCEAQEIQSRTRVLRQISAGTFASSPR